MKGRSSQRMRKDIAKEGTGKEIEKSSRREVEVLEPVQTRSPFITFHYSYKEVSSVGGQTRVGLKERRFADGKLESEAFEGTLGGHVCENMVADMQGHFLSQMELLMKPVSLFLPFEPRDRRK